MDRYRLWLFGAALAAGAGYLAVWHAAAAAPGVLPAPDALALPLDDAAIYFQYARQALHGEWLRYNPGAALSTGVTSPLYFLLVTLGLGLGLNAPAWAWCLGLAGLVLGLVSADRLARRLFPALPPWWTGALLLSQGAWVAAHFNAMETGLQLGLTWALLDALSDPEAGARTWGALAALAFTRPEGQVLALLLGGAWAWRRPGRLAGVLALAAAPSLVLLILSGTPVPDSVRPKSAALTEDRGWLDLAAAASLYAQGVLKGAWMGFWGGADAVGTAGDAAARNPIGPQFPPLGLLAALAGCFALAQRGHRRLSLAAASSLAALLGLLAWNLPVGWHSHRYLAAASPLLYLGMLAGLQALRASGRGGERALAAALFTLWAAFGLASWPWHLWRCEAGALDYARSNRNAALALAAAGPGPVAVVDSGLLAYYSGREIVDLLGITNHAVGLAARQGHGALLEALLDRPRPPVWAALHTGRPDFDPQPWTRLGLLKAQGPLAEAMDLYRWDFSGAERRTEPAALPAGRRVLGCLNVADLDDEARWGLACEGPDAGRSLMARLRYWRRGPEVPEGGRRVLALGLPRVPAGAHHLLMRLVAPRAGRLVAQAPGCAAAAPLASSDSEVYSEVQLDLPCVGTPLRLSFQPDAPGAPADFAVYRIWFLD